MTTALPPTTHALPSTQRANLIRSTRKLGALLGETPLVVEHSRGHGYSSSMSSVASTDSVASKRSARIFAAPSPRGPSLAATQAMPPSHTSTGSTSLAPADRPLLLLRLPENARPRPLSAVTINTPLSPGFPLSPPLSPMTPVIVVDRRKKMAKLVRTLGTNVPPELVFAPGARSPLLPSPTVVPAILTALAPPHDPSRRHYSTPSPRTPTRRMSDDSLASPTREAVASTYASTRLLAPRSGSAPSFSSGSGSDSDSDEWVEFAASSAPPSPRSSRPHYLRVTSPTWNSSTDDLHAGSLYTAHESTTSRATRDARFLSRHVEFRADSPFTQFEEEQDDAGLAVPRSTYRREQGWSGEWTGAGTGGMDDVVSRLRALR